MNNLFGRTKILASATQDELNKDLIGNILKVALPTHRENARQIHYLRKIDRGDQEIYGKTKDFRNTINNQVVENHINHAISFKKGYVFGYPAQYVQMTNDKDHLPPSQPNEETKGFDKGVAQDLGTLNRLMRQNDKASKDVDLSHNLYVDGVGVRYFVPTKDGFELYNLDPTSSFVVYNNGYSQEPLFGVYMVVDTDYETQEKKLVIKVYTERRTFTYNLPYADYNKGKIDVPEYITVEPRQEINALGHIPIVEYQLNRDRISLVERMLGGQNALNQLTSSEVDDVEQFVNAMMVFINSEIDEETLELAKEMGAVSIKSNGKQSGDVKMLTSKLDHGGTKVLYERIQHNMLINVGVPLINVGGGSGGDTGLARLTDNGWLMADTKAREDELSFIESEKYLLEMAIDYLGNKGILGKLDISNIETKFTRHKSDNLLTKTQALAEMEGRIHPDDAFAIVDLFSDPSQAVANANNFYGEDFFKKESTQSNFNDIQSEDEDETDDESKDELEEESDLEE